MLHRDTDYDTPGVEIRGGNTGWKIIVKGRFLEYNEAMFGIIGSLFVTFFYQPFFNLLVGIYLVIQALFPDQVDMGIAVIIFTVIFRILWLPMSLSSDRSEKEKRDIGLRVKEIKKLYRNEPIRRKEEIKKLLRSNRRVVVFSTINILFQILIALMLWRIFSKGLGGADFHLLYRFMPEIKDKFNLVFLGKYDLTHPSVYLNLIQTILIFSVEVLSTVTSPFPASRQDLTTIVVLPIASYLFFSTMPAGKKMFIIVTICFSIVLIVVKQVVFVYHSVLDKFSPPPEAEVKTTA